MTSQLGSGDMISDRYASALYELASESKLVDSILADLKLLQTMITSNKDLNLLIKSPLIASNEKSQIIKTLLDKSKANNLTMNFLKVIEKNKRFKNLFSIISQFIKINSQKRGDIIADIISVDSLDDKQQIALKEQLKGILGDKLSLNFKLDKKIIGGLVIKVGSKMIDTSLINKINKLKIAIKED